MPQNIAAGLVLAEREIDFTLLRMDAHERAVRRLPQRIEGEQSSPQPPPKRRSNVSQPIEYADGQIVQPLTFLRQPLFEYEIINRQTVEKRPTIEPGGRMLSLGRFLADARSNSATSVSTASAASRQCPRRTRAATGSRRNRTPQFHELVAQAVVRLRLLARAPKQPAELLTGCALPTPAQDRRGAPALFAGYDNARSRGNRLETHPTDPNGWPPSRIVAHSRMPAAASRLPSRFFSRPAPRLSRRRRVPRPDFPAAITLLVVQPTARGVRAEPPNEARRPGWVTKFHTAHRGLRIVPPIP